MTPTPDTAGELFAFPASFAQQRLWFLDQIEPGAATYNIPLGVGLAGRLDLAVLAAALQEVTARHETLRTTFVAMDGEPVQVVAAALDLPLPVVDLRGLSGGEEAARELAWQAARRPFDLARGPLLRALLLRLADDEHRLLLNVHHIVADGWSMGVLIREILTLYGAFVGGLPSPLPELPVQYVDYAVWQREWLEAEAAGQIAWWRERLRGAPVLLELPTDRPRTAARTGRGGERELRLPRELSDRLQTLSRRQGLTSFMTLLAAFQGLLSRWSGQCVILVGAPVANRHRPEIQGLIGFFVNTLVLRIDLPDDPTFHELLSRVRGAALGAFAHQELPFERLVEELAPERSLAHTPLFQVMFSLQPGADPLPAPPGLALVPLAIGGGSAKFDLQLTLEERADGLTGAWSYSRDLFDAPTIARLDGHLQTLLAGIAASPGARLSELPILTEAELHQLAEWSANAAAYRTGCSLHRLIEEQVERSPDAVAVTGEGGCLSFRELDRWAARLALSLRGLGVGPEVRVGLCAERSPELMVGLLAILKAGGAYVPLDPDYPRERLAFMIEDARAPVLLVQPELIARLPETAGARVVPLVVNDLKADTAGEAEGSLPGLPPADPDSLAYVIYTSGSTGRPKGVMNTHRGIVNRLLWMQETYGLGPGDAVLQKTPMSFDVSVWELFWPLLAGARLVLARPGGHRDPHYLAELIAAEGITTAHFVPSLLGAFLDDPAAGRCSSLRRVVASGEALSLELVRRFFASGLTAELHNLYGPTEAAVDVTFWRCEPPRDEAPVPVGRPVANTRLGVLDREMRPVPAGVVGELFLGGVQVARGYLRRPDLTAERFVPDPGSHVAGERLYRTGDLARYRADGAVEYLGRVDHQVKIRGFRIELGEIEAALAQHSGVREAAVLVRDDAARGRGLVAYVAVRPEAAPAARELRQELRRMLPDYMVPGSFVILGALPLQPNGKVDRRALMALGTAAPDRLDAATTAPRTPDEELIAMVWAELLDLPTVGVHDDFFALGGHSLLATRVISRMRQRLGVELPLRAIFETPTVAALAARLSTARRHGGERQAPPIPLVPRAGALPLSFAQERLWFLDQLEAGSPAYNVPAAFLLTGELAPAALHAALAGIVRRHEVLRTTFGTVDGRPMQRIAPVAVPELPLVDLAALPPPRRETELRRLAGEEARRPFDLAHGPLLRTSLLRLASGEGARHAMLATMHHIASDGWSIGVLAHELTALYGAAVAGRPSPLPDLRVQYADFAVWQRQWLQGEILAGEIAWWRGRLAGAPPVLELPADRSRPAVQRSRGAQRPVRLPVALAVEFAQLGRREGATLFMVLLALFQSLLRRYTGRDDLVVGSPVANRQRVEIEELIGFFVNTLVLRLDLPGDPSLRQLLARAREVCLDAWAHQDVPFEKLVEELRPQRGLAHAPFFQVMLTVQNAPSRPFELPGLAIGFLEVATGGAKFDLTLALQESEGSLAGTLEYNVELFDEATMERLLGHLLRLSAAAVIDPEARLSTLPLLSPAEGQQLLVEGRALEDVGLRAAGLHRLFETQVERRPAAIALVCQGHSMTYRDLDRQANQLAHLLLDRGVGPDVRVGLCMERSPEMVVGILGVLKAGGAYVPLDPALPRERLCFQLEDAGVTTLVTQAACRASVSGWDGPLLCLDEGSGALGGWPDARPRSSVEGGGGDGLAYVLYTSGSTGRPKGVAVTHSNVMRLLEVTSESFGFGSQDVWTLFHSYAFDFSVWELWGALAHGGRAVVVPQDLGHSPEEFFRLLCAERVTVLNQTPSAFRQLAPVWDAAAGEPPVRWIIFGGEALELSSLSSWLGRRGSLPRLANMYGITETTVHVTLRRVRLEDTAGAARSLIGGPLADLELYVTDRDLCPLPLGVAGELCVGGAGLARGYWRRPDLTAGRFVPDPWSGRPGARLYRSGDLARRLPDGDVEYLGRIDHQVKVRGLRIELGEIEAALGRHPAVRACVVQAMDRPGVPGDRRLAAWVVVDRSLQTSAAELRAFLGERLAGYMVPTSFVLMEALPLTANGKVDRAALPSPEGARPDQEVSFVAPRTREELAVAAAWQEVLGVERVGVDDNFFDLGGHSLLMVQVQSRLRQVFAREILVLDLFQHPTVGALARHLGTDGVEAAAEPASFETSESRGEDRRARAREQQLQRHRRRAGRTGDFEA
ncbi:MAG TPA: amino acid adenylation domain-containing protein [Thermoanaerobaculia bacterium]|nr:amino acid adenylation domain-containing protein [Thermoanaerobaculia bacterium]